MNYTLRILVMIWHGSSDHIRSFRRVKLNFPSINHILNLVFQCPTIISIMPRTVGMIGTPCIGIVVRRRSFGIWMRLFQRNQIHPQHVLQCLRQWHVDFGKLSPRLILSTLTTLLLLFCWFRIRNHDCPHRLLVVTLITTFLAVYNIGFLLPSI